jgi:hypothetical protein
MNTIDDYQGRQGITNEQLAVLLRQLLQQQLELAEELERIRNILEEKDARRRNRIIRQRIPARFMRSGLDD